MFGRVALLIYLYFNAWIIVIICGFMVLEIIRFFFLYKWICLCIDYFDVSIYWKLNKSILLRLNILEKRYFFFKIYKIFMNL